MYQWRDHFGNWSLWGYYRVQDYELEGDLRVDLSVVIAVMEFPVHHRVGLRNQCLLSDLDWD